MNKDSATLKKLMSELIEEETSKIEQNGDKVKLKTLLKKRVIYTLIFGVLFLLLVNANFLFLAFIALVVYFVIMYNLNDTSVIIGLAKKYPNKLISDVIKEDMR